MIYHIISNLELGVCRHYALDDVHPKGDMFVVCSAPTRAGNASMWELWFRMVYEFISKQQMKAEKDGWYDDVSRQAYVTATSAPANRCVYRHYCLSIQ